MRTVRALRGLGDRELRAKWVLPAYILIFVIGWGLFVASTSYSRDNAREAARAVATAKVQASQIDHTRCVQRLESRTEIRGMFEATFDALGEQATTPSALALIDALRARLNERYPPILEECPPPLTTPPEDEP